MPAVFLAKILSSQQHALEQIVRARTSPLPRSVSSPSSLGIVPVSGLFSRCNDSDHGFSLELAPRIKKGGQPLTYLCKIAKLHRNRPNQIVVCNRECVACRTAI